MTKSELIKKLNEAYPDGFLDFYWNAKTQRVRNAEEGDDTLALFIVREVESVWDGGVSDVANLDCVANALDKASAELGEMCEIVGKLSLEHAEARKCKRYTKKRKKGSSAW